jgi:hypothetical protein
MMRPHKTGDVQGFEILATWCNQTKNYWPGLFHCYADPRIPGTNNSLELFIKEMKQMVRLLSRNPNPATRVIRHAATNAIVVTRPELPGKEFLAKCSPQLLAKVEKSLKFRRRRNGAVLRVRRDVQGFANGVLERWKRVCAERQAQKSRIGSGTHAS